MEARHSLRLLRRPPYATLSDAIEAAGKSKQAARDHSVRRRQGKRPSAALAIMLAISLPLLFASSGCSGDSTQASPSKTASASPATLDQPTTQSAITAPPATASPTEPKPTRTPFGGIARTPLRAGDPVSFPDGVALYASDGRWEGPIGGLRRYTLDSAGELRIDDLLISSGTEEAYRGLVGVVSGPGGGELAAGLCHGQCYGEWEPVTFVHSGDGGMSWYEVGTLEEPGWGSAVAVHDGRVLVEDFRGRQMLTLPAGAPQLPVSSPYEATDGAHIIAGHTLNGLLLATLADDGRTVHYLDGSGDVMTRVPLPAVDLEPRNLRLVPRGKTSELHVAWSVGVGRYLGIFDWQEEEFLGVYEFSVLRGVTNAAVTAWLSDTLAIGRGDFALSLFRSDARTYETTSLPAIIDFANGTVSPIAEFLGFVGGKGGGPVPVAALTEPFARVAGAGDCLNVRAEPRLGSAVLGCFLDGVLLPLREGSREQDGMTWLAVKTPIGVEGWAADTFLEVHQPFSGWAAEESEHPHPVPSWIDVDQQPPPVCTYLARADAKERVVISFPSTGEGLCVSWFDGLGGELGFGVVVDFVVASEARAYRVGPNVTSLLVPRTDYPELDGGGACSPTKELTVSVVAFQGSGTTASVGGLAMIAECGE